MKYEISLNFILIYIGWSALSENAIETQFCAHFDAVLLVWYPSVEVSKIAGSWPFQNRKKPYQITHHNFLIRFQVRGALKFC